MPTAEEHTSTTTYHIANRHRNPTTPWVCTMATWPKRQPTVQHQRHSVKVRRPPPCSWGMHPPLLTTREQVKHQHHAQGHHSNHALRLCHNPPMATAMTTVIGGHQEHPLHPLVHRVQGPRHCTQVCGTDCPIPNARAPPPTTTTMVHDHDSNRRAPPAPPFTPSTGHEGPGVMHKRMMSLTQFLCATTISRHDRCTTNHSNRRAPAAPPTTVANRAQKPWHCTQACSAGHPVTAANCPACTRALHPLMHHHHPLPIRDAAHVTHLLAMSGPRAPALHTSTWHQHSASTSI